MIDNDSKNARAAFAQNGFDIASGAATFTAPSGFDIVGIVPLPSWTGTAVIVDGMSTAATHLSSDGTSGGSAITLTSPDYGRYSSVISSSGIAKLIYG
jgi:hypothetical protein